MNLLARQDDDVARAPISPRTELGAYEALWLEKGATFKKIADRFAKDPDGMPSDYVNPARAEECAIKVFKTLKENGVDHFGIRIHHAGEYPMRLRHAKNPIELLYYQGIWELVEKPSVSIVGSREPSEDGIKRAERLARELVARGYTIVSGLAKGIDTAAHNSTLEAGGRTIAVVGTPLGQIYPKENAELQNHILSNHLLISQIPVLRYSEQDYRRNRVFFPERNATMSALTQATIIVEANDTSGTLTQARAALHQGRKLFILNSCFERGDITWPAYYEKRGAIRVREPDDIWEHLD